MTRILAKSADASGYKEPLAEHTINDIKAGRCLIQNLPFGLSKKRRIAKDLDLALALHDVGKAATGFQQSLDTHKPWGKRHEILSAAAATELGLCEPVILAVLTHHKQILSDGITVNGCLPDEQVPYTNHKYTVWHEMASQYEENLPLLTIEAEQIFNFIRRSDLLARPLNLSILSDDTMKWLHRNKQTKTFRYKQREYVSLLRGLVMSADHIASAGNYVPAAIPLISDYGVTSYQLYGFQERASKSKGNLILRAPTGSGKTEAALLWARLNQQVNGRLFYALPTTASINAMYLRLQKAFNDTENKRLVGLLHSRATSALYSMFEQDGKGEALANQQVARNLSGLVREMYFPIRVCTPHQILRYSLQGKGWEAMLSEFPHGVFVFDEIHAYNPKLTGLTMATARYLAQNKATCMFLTATLPTFIHELIERQLPGIQFIQPSCDDASDKRILEQKRHTVEALDGNIMGSLEKIISESEKASSTLLVCNHVPTAQQVYKELLRKVSDTVLLHSRFTRRDRNRIENDLQRSNLSPDDHRYKPPPKILVATQVVEVSLNLDFQQCFTEPAAIDALVQRMGRVNRKGSQQTPAKVYIFTEQYSDDNHVYSEKIRDDSLKVLTSLPIPLSEERLNSAADKVYGNGYQGDDLRNYREGLDYDKLKQFKRYLIAGTSQNWIEEVIEEQEGTIELLPEQLLDDHNGLREQGLTIAAYDLLVPVARRRIAGLVKDGRIDTEQDPWLLKDCEYSMKVGLELDSGEHTSYVTI